MIRIDALWLCSQPQDMRAGADRLLTVVVNTLGEARAHHGYLRDVLERINTHPSHRLEELLPHRWRPA